MFSPRTVPACFLGLCLAVTAACGGGAVITAPAAARPLPVISEPGRSDATVDQVWSSCGASPGDLGKLDPKLHRKLREGSAWFYVIVKFTANLPAQDVEGLGFLYLDPGSEALGNVESLAALSTLCSDARVEWIELAPDVHTDWSAG